MTNATWSAPDIGLRLLNWEQAFVDILHHHLDQPFAWGVSDCLIVPAELCWGMTGVQPFPRPLRQYRTAAGAQRVLTRLGFESVETPLEQAFRPVANALARRGDCGTRRMLVDGIEVLSTFIVLGNGTAVGKAEGLNRVVVPVSSLERTFQIGLRPNQVGR